MRKVLLSSAGVIVAVCALYYFNFGVNGHLSSKTDVWAQFGDYLGGVVNPILSFITNFGKSTAGGGSTITQQVVKNVTQDKQTKGMAGAVRKLKEWVKAYQIEEVMSKDQILELYLNLIL